MRYIGNGDQQAPAALICWFGKNRVIKIARIGPINGHKRGISQITAGFDRRCFQRLGLTQSNFGKFMSDIKFGKSKGAKGAGLVAVTKIGD